MKQIVKNTAILLVITAVASIALAFVYELTKEPIALAEQKAKAEAYQAVYDGVSFDILPQIEKKLQAYNKPLTEGTEVQEILVAKGSDGAKVGYAVSVSSNGYGGPVTIALGIDVSGKVVGYAVLNHQETPGFGANCTNGDVVAQFNGITAADQLDGITGATLTTNALKRATQAAIDLVNEIEGEQA